MTNRLRVLSEIYQVQSKRLKILVICLKELKIFVGARPVKPLKGGCPKLIIEYTPH
jgi:hypothetical protein